MRKALIVGGGGFSSYHQLFVDLGYEITQDIAQASILVFTGGEDVSSWMYDHPQHRTTYSNEQRDVYESTVFADAAKRGIPMVGICRGGQFLNVMNGGEMYQDVTLHTRAHSITDVLTGEVVYVSSTHHQMMKPSQKAVLVASSTLGGEREWWTGEIFKREVSEQDVEVVFYPDTRSLCFQPHPEFGGAEYVGMVQYFATLLTRYLES